MWKSVAAFIAAVTLLPRSLTGIVAFPLALDELVGGDAVPLVPAGVVLLLPVPELVDVHPATSAEHATDATATANDLRKPVPSRDLRGAAKLPRLRQDPQEQGNPAHGAPEYRRTETVGQWRLSSSFGGHQ